MGQTFHPAWRSITSQKNLLNPQKPTSSLNKTRNGKQDIETRKKYTCGLHSYTPTEVVGRKGFLWWMISRWVISPHEHQKKVGQRSLDDWTRWEGPRKGHDLRTNDHQYYKETFFHAASSGPEPPHIASVLSDQASQERNPTNMEIYTINRRKETPCQVIRPMCIHSIQMVSSFPHHYVRKSVINPCSEVIHCSFVQLVMIVK